MAESVFQGSVHRQSLRTVQGLGRASAANGHVEGLDDNLAVLLDELRDFHVGFLSSETVVADQEVAEGHQGIGLGFAGEVVEVHFCLREVRCDGRIMRQPKTLSIGKL